MEITKKEVWKLREASKDCALFNRLKELAVN